MEPLKKQPNPLAAFIAPSDVSVLPTHESTEGQLSSTAEPILAQVALQRSRVGGYSPETPQESQASGATAPEVNGESGEDSCRMVFARG